MKIIEILPELDIGGVERHVVDLSNELNRRGHDVLVVSAGGKMESQLDEKVQRRHLPVHKKNPLTCISCARKIARWAQDEGWQMMHAHSRVPAWIANIASDKAHVPYLVTAHCDFGNKSRWIYAPYRKAPVVICVSDAVRESMKDCFYENTKVIINGLDVPSVRWKGDAAQRRLLFVGRLSHVKGLQDVLQALDDRYPWTLDVLGDGPQMQEWKDICRDRGFEDRVTFHGYSDEVDRFMSGASCLLFPSYSEGWGLTLARAIQIGLPVIASDIPPVAEMLGGHNGLIPPGDISAWKNALDAFLKDGKAEASFPLAVIPTLSRMVGQTEALYLDLCKGAHLS